ncbi:hypothetical protein [Thermoproteus tenax]|nr:hypothetical protein [Thermoproteus tenax]
MFKPRRWSSAKKTPIGTTTSGAWYLCQATEELEPIDALRKKI